MISASKLRSSLFTVCFCTMLGSVVVSSSSAMDNSATPAPGKTPSTAPVASGETLQDQALTRKLRYALFQKHCTACHDSVADPERPGKTRDEWYRLIVLMRSHGLSINQREAEMIVDLLYELRKGAENEAG